MFYLRHYFNWLHLHTRQTAEYGVFCGHTFAAFTRTLPICVVILTSSTGNYIGISMKFKARAQVSVRVLELIEGLSLMLGLG